MPYSNILSLGVSVRAAVAELVGMTLFITYATGTAVGLSLLAVDDAGEYIKGVHTIGTAAAFGFAIVALAYATGHTSGGQFNPAISIGLLAAGALPLLQCVVNIVCQVVGAIIASSIVYGMIPGGGGNSTLAGNSVPDGLTSGRAFLGEMIGTMGLVFVVLETACNVRSIAGTSAPLPIGFTVFIAHLLLIPYTSCSINPARSLGPAIVSGDWGNEFWVFMIAPVIGGLLAAAVHLFFASDWDTITRREAEDVKQDYTGEMEDMIEQIAMKMGIPDRKSLRMQKLSADGAPHTKSANVQDAPGGAV